MSNKQPWTFDYEKFRKQRAKLMEKKMKEEERRKKHKMKVILKQKKLNFRD